MPAATRCLQGCRRYRYRAREHHPEVDANGDLAGEVGIFTLSVPGENGATGATKVTGKYIVIWKRSGHTWQLHRDIWNTN